MSNFKKQLKKSEIINREVVKKVEFHYKKGSVQLDFTLFAVNGVEQFDDYLKLLDLAAKDVEKARAELV